MSTGKSIQKFSFTRQALLVCLLGSVFFSWVSPVQAQNTGLVIISVPEVSRFPSIHFFMSAYDEQGNLARDITPEDVQVIEDGKQIPLQNMELVQPGLQIITAFNLAPIMANAPSGQSTFEIIRQQLVTWTQSSTNGSPDDFSLASNTGLQAIRLKNPLEWEKALLEYQPDLFKSQPSVASLSQALDLATDPNPNPQMKRTILYITPLPDNAMATALSNLSERAVQSGVRIHVWLVANPKALDSKEAQPLTQLTDRTGGQIFVFSGVETLPDPNLYYEQMRYLFQASYTSQATLSGEHNLRVSVQRPTFQAQSDEQTYKVEVSPPNPIFLSPPEQIHRSPAPKTRGTMSATAGDMLTPETLDINTLIEFPDGYVRDLKSIRLYVNDVLAAETREPPFEKLHWNLENVNESGTLNLRLEVEDQLGLHSSSIEIPVEVIVEKPQRSLLDTLGTQRLIIFISLVAAGSVLLLALFYTSRQRLAMARQNNTKHYKDPVSQPVPIRQEMVRTAASMLPTTPRVIGSAMNAPARLVRLADDGTPMPSSVVSLNRREITFGSDSRQAIQYLDSPSVSPLHARLYQSQEGVFILADAGSTTGTWANYTPVSSMGVRLEHGDTIHFGRVAYRFELRDAPPQR